MSPKKKLPAALGGTAAFTKPFPITEPTIPAIGQLKRGYEKILKSRMITNSGLTRELEKKTADYIGVKHAIAVNSCTSGLMLIVKILKLKGEVILPGFTFHATAHAAVWNGLRPVFVDCDPATYNIDPRRVEKAVTHRTSAILAVHIFGNPPDIEALERIAKMRGLKLIFDAAHGFGAEYNGKKVGGFGNAESFSMSPTKLVTAGEGGMVTTNSEAIASAVRCGRNYGDPGTYDCEFSGLSARMNEFSALLGIASLDMLDKNVKRRADIVKAYKDALSGMPGISFQHIEKGSRSSFKDFSIMVDEAGFGMNRDQLYNALMAENIVVKKYFYPPLHFQKAFRHFSGHNMRLKNTEAVSRNILSLPLFSHIRKTDVGKICCAILNIHRHGDVLRVAEKKA